MNSRTPLLEKRGIIPAEYWALMELPEWLTKVWVREEKMPKPKIKKTREKPPHEKPYRVNPWKVERMEAILKLKAEGKTLKEIATHFDLNSGSAISHWIKKYGNGFDI